MSIKVDENDPVGELEPSFPYKDVTIRRNVDMKEFYDLESEIGRGKFGTVYRCREKSTGLALAAKFVGIAKREDRRNVEREVQIMRMLQHPRIIQLYDAFEASNVMCVVQELIEGGELFDRVIGDDFILTEKSCTVFVRQICEGVAFIHSKNVLHLDLKPENILCLTKAGNRIKIIDFGLAREYDSTKKLQVLFGTPEFVAPEVVNFDAIGFGTDMWSIGVICYVLLSGLSPFMGETDVETMANVTIAQYDFDDEAFDDISEDAKDFIRKLLVKTKDSRYSAAQCLNHPWLMRRPPVLTTGLETTKENLKETVDRWSEREQSPTQISVISLPPTPPTTPVANVEPALPVVKIEPILPPIATQPPSTEDKCVKPEIKIKEEPKKGVKNPGELPSPNPSKQPKIEMASVKSKEIKDTGPEEVKVSTYTWSKKKPTVTPQTTTIVPGGKTLPEKEETKPNSDNKFLPKSSVKPSPSKVTPSSTFNSRIQQGSTEITISKKSLNPSPQPKIAGIVLGQTLSKEADVLTKTQKVSKPITDKPSTEPKPKVITHKIMLEGKDITEELSTEGTKPTPKISQPINIDNNQRFNPLLRNLQTDRFERRCSDISCFLHDIGNSTDGASIMNEIKKLSTRLFESDLLDESNNNSSNFFRQIANRGVGPRRPKFRMTNLNRDVPIGSPPPPTNMTYFIPPNPLIPETHSTQTHSAPQSPRASPSRMPEDVILRLLDEHVEQSSVANYVRSTSDKQKNVTSISSK